MRNESGTIGLVGGTGKIRILPDDVVSRIAAGEIVERPAAVVKELIENSLDAHSSSIAVEVKDGGRTLLKVVDDGEGLAPSDAPMAFQRHATSKLRTESDLSTISTMGFRGEALPSIASVSKVRMVTSSRHEREGTELVLSGGTLLSQQETAAAPGTQIEVTDLFFNTPARRKFLKAAATEFSYICQVVQQAALAWHAVHFRLRHNGQEVFDYPAVASSGDRILQVYGPRLAEQMIPIRVRHSGVAIEGAVVKPLHVRTTRSPQDLFVNRRPVKNGTVFHAIYEAYGVALAKGTHPLFILSLEIHPASVDINVHPTKREVRFSDQAAVHQLVARTVREVVRTESIVSVGPLPLPSHAHERTSGDGASLGSMDGPSSESVRPSAPDRGSACQEPNVVSEAMRSYLVRPAPDVIPLGQINRTFLVAQVGTDLHVIDQHTAHERVLFERFSRAWADRSITVQPLLIPETVEVPPHAGALLETHIEDLAKLGVEIEPFGRDSFVVRGVPALLGRIDHAGLVHDLIEDLEQWHATSSLESKLRPLMATLSCHSAVRAGRAMALPEIKGLIENWIEEGLPTTCPHGRRVALRLPAEELAKIFGR